ncbi:hypothetical protein [Bdellovibrio bacteriovorus]|uniref:hypothetical protein n=1 Tax=Bdellovibrio bacteriovorus TaxID=959 RepID=UPI0035A57BE8
MKSIIKNGPFLLACGTLLVMAFQNCSPSGFNTSHSISEDLSVAARGFPSEDETEMASSNIPIEDRNEPVITLTPVTAPSSGQTVFKQAPEFSLESASRNSKNSLIIAIRQATKGSFYALDTTSTDIHPVFLRRYTLSNLANPSPHALNATLLSSFGGLHRYQVTLTELILNQKNISLKVVGLCDFVLADGKKVPTPANWDPSCESNVVVVDLESKAPISFSGPAIAYHNTVISQPFVATGIQGIMAGCNLEDRRNAPGASLDGTIQGCNWLQSPSGWVNTGHGIWKFQSVLSSGTGSFNARFVVADIINNQVRATSAPLKVQLQSR